MKLTMSLCVLFFISNAGWAQTDSKWKQLIQTAVNKGQIIKDSADQQFYYLTHLDPNNRSATHRSDYFTVEAVIQTDGRVVPAEIDEVSENWVLRSDGKWSVDQWIYKAWPDEEFIDVDHDQFIEAPNGDITGDKIIPTPNVSSPLMQKQWQEKLNQWYGWHEANFEGPL